MLFPPTGSPRVNGLAVDIAKSFPLQHPRPDIRADVIEIGAVRKLA
jgi:hypothetical protein